MVNRVASPPEDKMLTVAIYFFVILSRRLARIRAPKIVIHPLYDPPALAESLCEPATSSEFPHKDPLPQFELGYMYMSWAVLVASVPKFSEYICTERRSPPTPVPNYLLELIIGGDCTFRVGHRCKNKSRWFIRKCIQIKTMFHCNTCRWVLWRHNQKL